VAQVGADRLTPDPSGKEPISNPDNPRWRIGEAWRVLNIHRTLLSYAGTGRQPVAAFLTAQGTNGLDAALFPDSLRTMLLLNEGEILRNYPNWIGRNAVVGAGVPPANRMQVGHAGLSRIGWELFSRGFDRDDAY